MSFSLAESKTGVAIRMPLRRLEAIAVELIFRGGIDMLIDFRTGADGLEHPPKLAGIPIPAHHLVDLLADAKAAAERQFEQLRRYSSGYGTPERVKHHVHRGTVREKRHILGRHDLGDHSLLAVDGRPFYPRPGSGV